MVDTMAISLLLLQLRLTASRVIQIKVVYTQTRPDKYPCIQINISISIKISYNHKAITNIRIDRH